MQPGDLLEWKNIRWVVRLTNRRERTATLLSEKEVTEWVPLDLEKRGDEACRLICNPSQDWPFIAIASNTRRGRLRGISRVPMGVEPEHLRPYYDWVPSDPLRLGGGPVFFNPALRLGPGEMLLALFDDKKHARITVPLNFGTVKQRQERATVKPKIPRTAFDRLLDDDDPFGGDDDA